MLIVDPKNPAAKNKGKSLRRILRLWGRISITRSAGIRKRKNARVNGWMVSMDHLSSGDAAPQIILAIMSARIASFVLDMNNFLFFHKTKERKTFAKLSFVLSVARSLIGGFHPFRKFCGIPLMRSLALYAQNYRLARKRYLVYYWSFLTISSRGSCSWVLFFKSFRVTTFFSASSGPIITT